MAWEKVICSKCGTELAEIQGCRIRFGWAGAQYEGNTTATIKCACGVEHVILGQPGAEQED